MAAEEDNFDIDIYGDGEGGGDLGNESSVDYREEDEHEFTIDEPDQDLQDEPAAKPEPNATSEAASKPPDAPASMRRASTKAEEDNAKPAPQQGVKRKETSDSRSVDHGATNALMLSDLHWWTTEDDIRGWINEAEAEEDLMEITFSEHKVNGKSKGQVYLEFSSPQASTAAKRKIDSLGEEQHSNRKFSVVFTTASQNPFKTLPKDAPARAKDDRSTRGGSAPYNSTNPVQSGYNNNMNSGYRGGRGGGFNRGSGYNRGGYNHQNSYERNFSGPAGGYVNGGFQSNNMGMMNNYNGFNRGGFVGSMRGGRGGMMPMGGFNPMLMGTGMNMNMPGFQGNQFNPGMFHQGPNFGGGDWNQHGAKRQRQE